MKNIFIILIICPIFLFSTESFLDIYMFSSGEANAGNTFSSTGDYIAVNNPAGNLNVMTFKMLYEHKFLMDNISSYNAASVTIPIFNTISTGISYINQNIDNIPIYGEYPGNPDSLDFEPLGYFSDNAHAFYFNIAYTYVPSLYTVYELAVGTNIKYIYHNIYNNTGMGSGFDIAADLLLYMNRINYKWIGLMDFFIIMQDVGTTEIKWNTASENIDQRGYQLVTGIGYSLPDDVLKTEFNTEVNAKYGRNNGMGAAISMNYNNMAGITTGINYEEGLNNYSFSEPRAGVFILFSGFEVHYSISSSELGLNHSVTVGYSYDK